MVDTLKGMAEKLEKELQGSYPKELNGVKYLMKNALEQLEETEKMYAGEAEEV